MSKSPTGNSSITLVAVIGVLLVLGVILMFLLFIFSGLVTSPLSVVSLVIVSGMGFLVVSVAAAILAFRSKRAGRRGSSG